MGLGSKCGNHLNIPRDMYKILLMGVQDLNVRPTPRIPVRTWLVTSAVMALWEAAAAVHVLTPRLGPGRLLRSEKPINGAVSDQQCLNDLNTPTQLCRVRSIRCPFTGKARLEGGGGGDGISAYIAIVILHK